MDTRSCSDCGEEKPLDEFYLHSGLWYFAYCKECAKLRRSQHGQMDYLSFTQSGEEFVVRHLWAAGIPSLPGKTQRYNHGDILAYGCIGIEVKTSILNTSKQRYQFTFTPRQRQRGIKGKFVVLVLEDVQTAHIFRADEPYFYIEGRLKTGFEYKPYRKFGRDRGATLDIDIMEERKSAWELITQEYARICDLLRAGHDLRELMGLMQADTPS